MRAAVTPTIGETKKPLHLRLKDHYNAIFSGNETASAMSMHYNQQHLSIPDPPFTARIIDRAIDSADLLIREALWICNKKPKINRDRGWESLANKYRK